MNDNPRPAEEEDDPIVTEVRAGAASGAQACSSFEAITNAEYVLKGTASELLAVHRLDSVKVLVVAYREVDPQDGFLITAFVTSRVAAIFKRRRQIWPSSN